MSTSELGPPPEVSGGIGQLGDPGGGVTPALTPTPAPNAMANASPGLTTGAAQPSGGPTLPSGDPASLAVILAQMANQLFVGPSVSPVPTAPNTAATSLAGSTVPTSPGFSPALLASAPGTERADIDVTDLSANQASPAIASPAMVTPVAPTVATSAPATPASPFSPASLDSLLAGFEVSAFAAPFGELFRLPLVDTDAPDVAPYLTHDAQSLGLESDLGVPLAPAHEVSREDPSLIRNLGGNAFDPYAVRRDFPILDERVHGKRLVWLDNAATTQKPRAVIDRLSYFYEHENSNIHRAAHTLAARATDAYEGARETTRRFVNAPSAGEIIFVRGATEGINLLAKTYGRANVGEGDEIIITHLEHHANIVPWQQLCAETGARLKVAPVDDRGQILLAEYDRLFTPRTKLASITQVSNALGTITPAREMIEIAHRHGAIAILDGAQAVSHMRVDVQLLDCDFYVFSGHKVFAPTGIGAVYGKRELLEAMPPWQGGGNMIADVTFEKTVYQPPPFRFEAGTGNIADAVGLGAALDYVMKIGLDVIDRYEHELLGYATERLLRVPGLRMLGTAAHKAGVMSFVLDGQRTEDVGAALDKDGIAVRSGHHCAQPILRRLGVEASVRASLAFYNVTEDIDALVESLHRLQAGRRLK